MVSQQPGTTQRINGINCARNMGDVLEAGCWWIPGHDQIISVHGYNAANPNKNDVVDIFSSFVDRFVVAAERNIHRP